MPAAVMQLKTCLKKKRAFNAVASLSTRFRAFTLSHHTITYKQISLESSTLFLENSVKMRSARAQNENYVDKQINKIKRLDLRADISVFNLLLIIKEIFPSCLLNCNKALSMAVSQLLPKTPKYGS